MGLHRAVAVSGLILLGACSMVMVAAPVDAADTAPASPATKTKLVLKLRSADRVPVRSRFEPNPPTIVLDFPAGRVAGALPERSVVQRGVIQEIRTAYAPADEGEARWIKSLSIQLKGRFGYSVKADAGQVTVEIEHPSDVEEDAFELGLTNGVLVAGQVPGAIQERFRAMQTALMEASIKASKPAALSPFPSTDGTASGAPRGEAAMSTLNRPKSVTIITAARPSTTWWAWLWLAAGLLATGVLGAMVWILSRRGAFSPPALMERDGPGAGIIEQLVWRAFEQQGYDITSPAGGLEAVGSIRTMTKDGTSAALQCISYGTFFEKSTVEQFVASMGRLAVQEGFLVAPGSFTVPAQRFAREHHVTLIGREQLTELLSAGARREHESVKMQEAYRQLETARENLNEYAKQLDLIRRQRNEACWLLGEERTKLATLESEREELAKKIDEWKAQAEQWQATAETNHKQWEESQWYLGESRGFSQHLESQLQPLQEMRAQLEERVQELTLKIQETERQRQETTWYLGESKSTQASLQQQVEEFEQRVKQLQESLGTIRTELESAQRNLQAERIARCRLEEQVVALQMNGERRRALRRFVPGVRVEVTDASGTVIYHGTPRDVSGLGVGLVAEPAMPFPPTATVRMVLPGLAAPIEAVAKLIWHKEDPTFNQSSGGYFFSELPAETRQEVERVVASGN